MRNRTIIILSLFVFGLNTLFAQQTPSKKLIFSFSERIRLTAFDNAISLNNESEPWTFSRIKTNLGLKYLPGKSIEFNFVLGNESRIWFSPESKKSKFSEIFVDQLYFKWTGHSELPLELSIGRQNIKFDEGFICLDAHPLVGSRSTYFNAIKAVYSKKKNQFTAFASYNPQTDDYMPIIYEDGTPQILEEQSNTGLGFYYKTELKNTNISAYYFRKLSYKNDNFPIESQINTLGAWIELPLTRALGFTTETAYQFGKSGTNSQNAFGAYFHLDYTLNKTIPVARNLSFGGFYLSGDNPSTSKNEGWNPLWSRWPKWSESYIYTLILENQGKVAYWSNMASLNFTLRGNFSEKVSFVASYYHLLALEDNETAFCDGIGKTRGDLITTRINYTIDANWSGHLVWENFTPGNFYPSTADGYHWIRFELLFKI